MHAQTAEIGDEGIMVGGIEYTKRREKGDNRRTRGDEIIAESSSSRIAH